MKNVLVLMHDDCGQEARFQAAIDLTRALNGHLTCVDIAMLPLAVGDYAEIGSAAILTTNEQLREAKNRSRMEARLQIEDVPYTWIDECGFLSACMRDAAGMADVIVLNRELDDTRYPDMLRLVGEMVIQTRKPIVAVPADIRKFDAYGSALIAWDGSSESEASLRAAVPLLSRASSITILEVDDGSLERPAAEAATYLTHHGLRSTVRRESPGKDLPSTIILNMIEAVAAGYVVMGGFGHGRWIEAALGGVTRRMLKECPVPLFLAH